MAPSIRPTLIVLAGPNGSGKSSLYEILIRQAALKSDVAHVYDNSKLNHPPERVLSFSSGKPSFVATRVPEWALRIYGNDLAP